MADTEAPRRVINLALQGGGAHGAFTWGVLDRLLEEPDIEFEGICGTSAGALNAVVLASGLAKGGRDGARQALDRFWRAIGEIGSMTPLQRSFFERFFGQWGMEYAPSYLWFDLISRIFSPYQFNPMNFNPLRDILAQEIDFEAIKAVAGPKLFICATNVRTGKVKVFERPELTVDMLLASACLPFLFQTVYVDGEPYWDGGYMGNPAIFPLIYGCESPDVMIVQINPIHTESVPTTAPEIMDRVNEISFNSSLMREMRAIHFVTKLIEAGKLDGELYKKMNMHMIEASAEMGGLGATSKLIVEPQFLCYLRDIGRQAADRWLIEKGDRINRESTLDLVSTFF